ncbi:MAG TPA: SCO family protein [Terriglobia bacterium]|jgi:protein SCO1/2
MVLISIAAAPFTMAQQSRPSILKEVGIDQHLGEQIDLSLQFRDETGSAVPLSKYFHGKPVVLAPVYLTCSTLCPMTLNSLMEALRVINFNAGKDFEVVVFSFDPKEGPAMAAPAKARYVRDYNRAGATNGFHFLTGSEESIRALTNDIGFYYKWDDTSGQWAHATGIMVATPEGKLSQYFYGLEYSARDLRLSMVQASREAIGNIVDRVLLYCYQYDPATGKYGLVVIRTVRLFGAATALGLFAFMFVMFRRDARTGRL